MFVELHIIQNFAPSCLNRDDTNTPKDCEFGGCRRARISSQCLKRAIRTRFERDLLLCAENLAKRTKRLVEEELVPRLARAGREQGQARMVVEAAIKGAGLGLKEDGKTEYLLFLGANEIEALARLMASHWDALSQVAAASEAKAAEKKSSKDKKKEAKAAVTDEVKNALLAVLDGGRAADLALFGRMLADLPDRNVDAACQVAHAISTNKVSMEMDFYTAVDDLKPEDTAGADMMGTVEYNSACFYRYANLDLEQLKTNLRGDEDLAKKTVEAFLRASVAAIPTGKQNSMAAQNPPSFIFAVVRESGLWSLANAFVKPVWPKRDEDLVTASIERLVAYWNKLLQVYGPDPIEARPAISLEDEPLDGMCKVPNLDDLVTKVMSAVAFK